MTQGTNNANDPFSRFWLDIVSKMTPPGMGMSSNMGVPPGMGAPGMPKPDEAARQMRQAFFDAWAKYCEEYLGSEPFLEAMRKSMDNALAFKQQVNEFLAKAVHEAQMPSREDTDSLMLVLRSMEERVLDRLEKLARRVDHIEHHVGAKATPPPSAEESKRRTKGVAK